MTLAEHAIQEYEDLERKVKINFQPMYPGVLIRVLPKEHISQGGIWLPDAKQQNKPIYEGIVLRTYNPYRLKLDNGKWVTMVAGVDPGDHILFPHWSGEPVPWLRGASGPTSADDEEYRIIPARGFLSLVGMKDGGEPFLILNYEKESVDVKIRKIIEDKCIYVLGIDSVIDINAVIADIKKEFDIFVKVKASKTTSGV